MATLLKTISLEFNKYYIMYLDIYNNGQNQTANTTSVYGVISLGAKSGGYISAGSKNWKITLNGSSGGSGTFDPDLTKNSGSTYSKVEKAKGSAVTVTHNTDGTKTINVSATVEFGSITLGGTTVGTKTVSGTVELPKIARNSSISSASSVSVNGTNNSTVVISPSVSTYSHKVTWSIGSYSHTESVAAGTTSVAYAIPESWKNAFPNAKSGTCKVSLETLSGTTRIGSVVSSNITLSCLGTELPNFTADVSDANGILGKIGCFVVGKSKLKADVKSPTYQFGATLAEVSISMEGTTYKGTSLSVTSSANIKSSGNLTVTFTLKDSRGYSKSISKTVTAYAYSNPSLALSISRYKRNADGTYTKDDGGPWGKVYYEARYSKIGTNSITVKIDYEAQTGTDSGSVTLNDDIGQTYVACNPDLVYQFEVSITDKLQTVTYRKQLSSDKTILDILQGGQGLEFGGVATEADTSGFSWLAKFRKGAVSVFEDTEATDEKDLITKKLALIPDGNADAIYLINGGWKGHAFGFGVASCISGFKTIRYWLANGNAYTGHKTYAGTVTVYKTTGSLI